MKFLRMINIIIKIKNTGTLYMARLIQPSKDSTFENWLSSLCRIKSGDNMTDSDWKSNI